MRRIVTRERPLWHTPTWSDPSQSSLREVKAMSACDFTHYCVEDFGAIGHASTPTYDSTSAIQAAFNAAMNTGGRVTFGAAAYLITSISRSGSNPPVYVQGRGRTVNIQVAGIAGTTLVWGGSAGGTMLSAVGFNGGGISGLQLDCASSNSAAIGLYVASSVGALYDSIDVLNASGHAYVIRGDLAGVYRNTFSNLSSQGTCNGGMLLDSTDIAVHNCDVADNCFIRIDLIYSGANGGLDLKSADTNQFLGLTVSCTDGATGGPLIYFRATTSNQRGGVLNTFYGVDGGTYTGTPAAIKQDASTANLIHSLSTANGIPSAVIGSNPQVCFVGYAFGSMALLETYQSGSMYFSGPFINVGSATFVSRSVTNPTNAINIFAGTAPAGTLSNGITLYAKDDGAGTKKLYYMDSAGTQHGPL